MGICGYLCRQGPNYLETYDPEGVKEDFGRNCDARGLMRILGKSTLKGSHVYKKREAIFLGSLPFLLNGRKIFYQIPYFPF